MRTLVTILALGGWLFACEGTPQRDIEQPAEEPEATGAAQGTVVPPDRTGVGGRVFVVEREKESLAVYDLIRREVLEGRITGLGNMRHAILAFSPDLKWGYVATRSGQLSRIDLETLERAGEVFTSENSIDIAISQDGRFVATAEYDPGGVTILDARTMAVRQRIEAKDSRVTGIVDAPGNRFVAVAMEAGEVWVIDAGDPAFPVTHRIPVARGEPYDAMITPDGRSYVVGHLNQDVVSVVDLQRPDEGARQVAIRGPEARSERTAPVKLPHMASWAVAGDHVFVPLVGRAELAVLDRSTFAYRRTIELRGHPVYAVASPAGHEVWVSFSGEDDDRFVQIVDAESLAVEQTVELGRRIYHMDFTPRGAHVLVSANGAGELYLVDASTREVVDREPLDSPSGVFGPWRAYRIGL
ncbi:MAG: cytochrome D1 domain-containing protein [Myxococcota bacterium]